MKAGGGLDLSNSFELDFGQKQVDSHDSCDGRERPRGGFSR